VTVRLVLLLVPLSLGCATTRGAHDDGPTPVIAISPGYVERIALMDRYRLHDEDRRRMMERPRVWVEEVEETEDAEPPADEGAGRRP